MEVATFIGPNEVFSPTFGLRWNSGVLEQAWQGSQGNVLWRAVPVVVAHETATLSGS